jgi:hypothetical protein
VAAVSVWEEGAMKFLCLAYGRGDEWQALPRVEQDAPLAQDERLRQRGDLVAAVDTTSTVVRAWDGDDRKAW